MIENAALNISEKKLEKKELTKEDFSFFANFDIITVRIIQKFYGKTLNPLDSEINCYTVQQLWVILNREGLKIGLEGLRKKLEFLVKVGFLEKVRTYPRIYMPLRDIEKIKRVQKKIEKLRSLFL
jgi:hypothetical protein